VSRGHPAERDIRERAVRDTAQRYMVMTCCELFAGDGRGAMASEWLAMRYHGLEITYLDALSHMAWDGHLYNGVPVSSQTLARGATELSVVEAAGGLP